MTDREIENINDGGQEQKRGKSLRAIILVIAIYALVVAAIAVIVDGRHVLFYMTGDEEMTVECGEPYMEPGVYAVTAGRIFGEGSKRLKVYTHGQVDTSSIGSYELEYSVRYGFRHYTAKRTVRVRDNAPPVISLEYTAGYRPNWFEGYTEEGFTAYDTSDGDLTGMVQRQVFEDKVLYTVTDSAGNTTTVERPLDYSIGKPEITLNGGELYEMRAAREFKDPGFTAVDRMGNDLSAYVHVEGEVIPYTSGEYQLIYSVSNTQGETVSAQRTVKVNGSALPPTIDPNEKTIYLTFDDGPGPYTAQLLDILAAYDVKVTFFVTCAYPDYFDMVGRAYREGHSIGVHSASHNYYSIYASESAFFEDFDQVEEMIYEQTGSYTDLNRFPGGSSNTVSSFNPGIMSRLTKAVTDMGYKYFDWNVTSGDAGETTDTNQIVRNIIDGCDGRKASIVLQHDIKDYSVAAVEQVIIWGLNNGYVFRPLDITSPGSHHAVFN